MGKLGGEILHMIRFSRAIRYTDNIKFIIDIDCEHGVITCIVEGIWGKFAHIDIRNIRYTNNMKFIIDIECEHREITCIIEDIWDKFAHMNIRIKEDIIMLINYILEYK